MRAEKSSRIKKLCSTHLREYTAFSPPHFKYYNPPKECALARAFISSTKSFLNVTLFAAEDLKLGTLFTKSPYSESRKAGLY